MIDFLRANTWCSREEYIWQMTVGQVKLSAFDFSRIEYSKKSQNSDGNNIKINTPEDLKNINDFGVPIINKK